MANENNALLELRDKHLRLQDAAPEPPHGSTWCGTCHCWYPADSAHSWGIVSTHEHEATTPVQS